MNFVLIGAAGYIAPRHLKAIKEVGGNLLAILDPSDSVGIIDSYFPDAHYFSEFERFERHVEKLKRNNIKIDYVSICSPNYLHDAHIRFAMRIKAHAICEKPIVLNPWNLEALEELSKESGKKIFTILQLRLHPSIIALRKKYLNSKETHKINLKYVTSRGRWYSSSWKGNQEKSGGLASNIGIHFFDMLIWIFGDVSNTNTQKQCSSKIMQGEIKLKTAKVNWMLSTDKKLLPKNNKKPSFRLIEINGEEIEFTDGFTNLHTKSYKEIIAGKGSTIIDAKPVINLVHQIRTSIKGKCKCTTNTNHLS